MRIILATTLLISVTYITPASAGNYGCGPAVQNWKNGSQTTCTYDSNGGAITFAPAAAPAAPPPVVEEDNCHEWGGYGGYEGRRSFKGYGGFKGFKGYGGNET